MTSKNVSHIIDKLFWFLIATAPLFLYLIYFINNDVVTFSTFISELGFSFNNSSAIYVFFDKIFSSGFGFLDVITSDSLIVYACYFVCIQLLHFCIDVFLIIIKIAHNFLDKTIDKGV